MGLKRITLKGIFIQYLLATMGVTVVMVYSGMIGINMLVQANMIVPANYGEKVAFELKNQLQGNERLSKENFEGICQYALFDKDYSLIDSNLKHPEQALAYLKGENSQRRHYVSIEGENEWAVIAYQLVARYNKPFLERYLPSVEVVYLSVMLGAMLLGVILTSSHYAKKLKNALEPLEKAVESIKEQNLDFEIEKIKVKEFDEISQSLKQLKEALQISLTSQWTLEKKKREQMAAIAHDIKTPLTIIKGNAQLLEEDEALEEEQKEFSHYIIKNSEQIEDYIKVLIEISISKTSQPLRKRSIVAEALISDIVPQARQLTAMKGIDLKLELPKEQAILEVDIDLISRALLNIISNGVDYTPDKGQIHLKAKVYDELIEIQVLDEGKGFSHKEIQAACEEFYMGDESRTRKGHYGMGLYITQQIIEKHEGKLILANRKDCQGAKVSIRLPIHNLL